MQYSIIHGQKSNISGGQNYTLQYSLPVSTLNYIISFIDRNSARVVDMEKSFDAYLENVMGYVYITYGPECEEFDSTKCQNTIRLYNCILQTIYNQHEHLYVIDSQG